MFQHYPIGEPGADYRAGVIASGFANTLPRGKNARPVYPEDVIPWIENAAEIGQAREVSHKRQVSSKISEAFKTVNAKKAAENGD